MPFRSDITVAWNLSPRVVTVAAPSVEVTIQDLYDTLRILEARVYNNTRDSIISAGGKEPLGGGVLVGLTATLRNAILAFEPRQAERTNGAVTTPDTDGELLTDSSATFITDGVTAGDWIINDDDGSTTSVIRVISETQVQTYPLDGGTLNEWSFGDAYNMWPVIQVNVAGGNLVAIDDVGADIDSILPTFGTQVVRTSSASATLQELQDIQYSSFGGGVTVDVLSANSGTTFPTGTPRQPVNNFTDALAIASERGFTTLFIRGNATVGAGDFRNFNLVGSGVTESTLTLNPIAQVDGASFSQCFLEGTLDGDVLIDDCVLDDLTFVDGTIQNSTLVGTLTLSGSQDAAIVNCRDGAPGSVLPVVDMNGTGSALNVQNWAGGIKITNKSGPEPVAIDLNAGEVILDATVTAGNIEIRGIGVLTNDATANVDTRGLLSKEVLFRQIVPGVYIDSINGIAGTAEGVGLPQTPVDNIVDAYTIAQREGYQAYYIRGSITLDRAYDNWNFFGFSASQSSLNVSGQSVTNTTFRDLLVSGAIASTPVDMRQCRVAAGVTGLNGEFRECTFQGSFSFANDATIVAVSCVSQVPGGATPICTYGTNVDANFRGWSGGLELRDHTAGCTTSVDLNPGRAVIGPTNVGGTILVRGNGPVEDTSAGATVIRQSVDFETAFDTIEFLKKISDNKLEVDLLAQELVLYDDDGVTPLRRYPLQTDGGEPVTTAEGVQTIRLPSVI